jgi:hypothetical protein
VLDIFQGYEENEAGVCCVRFFRMGVAVTVIVDTRVLFLNDLPKFVRPVLKTDSWWFCMVEKAWAKVSGSYLSIVGGWSWCAMHSLTDLWSHRLDMVGDQEVREDITSGELWRDMLRWHNSRAFMGASRKKMPDKDQGLVVGHAYAIVRVAEVDGNRLISIKNPWGHGEWTGAWSDGSDLWTDAIKQAVGWSDQDDGIFWMCFTDFTKMFHNLDVCHPLSGFQKKVIKGTIRPKGAPAAEQDQWLVRFPTSDPDIFWSLESNLSTGLWVAIQCQKGTRVTAIYAGLPLAQLRINGAQTYGSGLFCPREGLDKPWTVYPKGFAEGQEMNFILTLFSKEAIEVEEMKAGQPSPSNADSPHPEQPPKPQPEAPTGGQVADEPPPQPDPPAIPRLPPTADEDVEASPP